MSTVSTHTNSIGLGLKWIPRMASALSFVIIGLFLFGGNEPLQPISGHELIGFAFFPVGVLLGMAVGWRWQITGGVVSMLSLGAFYLWHFVATGSIALGPGLSSSLRRDSCFWYSGFWKERSNPMHDILDTPAIDFELKDTTGNRYRLSEHRGQWLLLVFHRHLG